LVPLSHLSHLSWDVPGYPGTSLACEVPGFCCPICLGTSLACMVGHPWFQAFAVPHLSQDVLGYPGMSITWLRAPLVPSFSVLECPGTSLTCMVGHPWSQAESLLQCQKTVQSLQTLSSCGGDAIHPVLRIRGTGLRD
jgi:hypothetical protein